MIKNPEKIKNIFWLIFILIPLFTGFLQYESAQNEYDERIHTALSSHDVECGTEGLNSCDVVDKWQDNKTGKIYYLSEFKTHRRHQAFRIACLSFLYGLIACAFYVWYEVRYGIKNIDDFCLGDSEREKLFRKQIINEKTKEALFTNAFIAVIWFIVI